MEFATSFPIRWSDMDFLGYVNNATYFTFFENARIAWLNQLGVQLIDEGPVVLTASATYLKPLIYPADVVIKLVAHGVKNSSFIIDYLLYQEDSLMTEGSTKMVWVDYKTGKSRPVPEFIREKMV